MRAYMRICLHICVCACIYAYVSIYAHVRAFIHICAYMRAYMRICSHICTCARIHAYMVEMMVAAATFFDGPVQAWHVYSVWCRCASRIKTNQHPKPAGHLREHLQQCQKRQHGSTFRKGDLFCGRSDLYLVGGICLRRQGPSYRHR